MARWQIVVKTSEATKLTSVLTCSDFIEIREGHFTAKSLRMLFKDISPEKIFNFLKEINIFGKM